MLNATAVMAPALPESPFRGIESFRFVDQPIFFARSEETRKLLRYVTVYRGVLFFGESGCGKSSLINAGFIPAIIAEGFTPDRLRVQPKPGEEIVVERISTRDTGEPPYLPSNFIGPDDQASRIVLSVTQLEQQLQDLRTSSPARRPLLIFDQFEEFATLFEEAPRGEDLQPARKAQDAILQLIIRVQRDGTLPVKLLFSFREDYLAKLSKLITLWPDLSDQSLRLTAPGREALPTIIRGSFEKFPGGFGKELSASLTHDLVTALEDRNEGGKLNLSEVQIACLQLWKASDPESLFKDKGVQGLLEDYLSDSLNRLPENLRDLAVALLSQLVTPSGTRNIVSEYDLISQVCEDEGIPEDRVKEACQALVQETKLVRRERRYDTYFYDIVSEFLVPWIRRQKIERVAAIERRKLEAIEQRKRRKILAFALATLLIALGVGATAYYIYSKRTVDALALYEVKHAQAEEKRAEDGEQVALLQKTNVERDRDNTKNAYAALVAQKAQGDADAQKKDADAQKKYADLDTKFQALQKSTNDQNDKLKQQINQLQNEVDQTHSGLIDIEKRTSELCSQLDTKQNNQATAECWQIRAAAGFLKSGLRQAPSRQ